MINFTRWRACRRSINSDSHTTIRSTIVHRERETTLHTYAQHKITVILDAVSDHNWPS